MTARTPFRKPDTGWTGKTLLGRTLWQTAFLAARTAIVFAAKI